MTTPNDAAVDVLAEIRTTYCSKESYAAIRELVDGARNAQHLLDSEGLGCESLDAALRRFATGGES